MGLFFRLLGLTAFVDEVLQSIRLNHFIRLSWIFVGVLLWYAVDGASGLGWLGREGSTVDSPALSALKVTLTASALGLLLIGWIRRNTIFRPGSGHGGGAAFSESEASSAAGAIDLRFTGRLDRGPGSSLRLRDFPVGLRLHDSGTISLEAHVAEGGSFDVLSSLHNTSGHWSLSLPRDALTEGVEEGTLYWGFWARPALRLRLPGRRADAILSVGSTAQRISLLRLFDAMAAEAAAREAVFFRTLGPGTDQPPPTRPPEPPKDAAQAVPWDQLIDFSR